MEKAPAAKEGRSASSQSVTKSMKANSESESIKKVKEELEKKIADLDKKQKALMAEKGKADSALNDKMANFEKQMRDTQSELNKGKSVEEVRASSALKTDVIQLIEMRTNSLQE